MDCDNNYAAIDGENSSTFIASKNGNYAVEISQGTCIDTSSMAKIATIKAITKAYSRYVSVSPNPTTGLLYIDRKVSETAEAIIKDELGRVLLNKQLEDKREVIDLSDFPAGVYFLFLSNNKRKIIEKIVKQ